MSGPQYIVLPVQGQNIQSSNDAVNVSDTKQLREQMAQITQTIQHNNEETNQKQVAEHPSFVKQVTSDPSILYSLINWKNPRSTLASFIAMMSLIISTRYISLVQWTIKALCLVLGASSLIEIVGRVATKDGIIARVRPQPYYRPSEYTYSRIFSELREAVDMILVKLQMIIFAENLQGTSIAFMFSFIAYWLVKAIPPFWLAIVATLFTYTFGPILTRQSLDANDYGMMPITDQKAQDLKKRIMDTASSATDHATNTAQNLSSGAMDTASSASDRVAGTAQDLKNRTIDAASSAMDHTTAANKELKNRTMGTVADTTNRAAGMGQDVDPH